MSNLEKIQKGMKVFQILSIIILVFACVGVALASIGATLVAADVLNMENQFLHFLSVTAEMSKAQMIGILTVAAVSVLFGGILTAFAYRYFTAELKEGTQTKWKKQYLNGYTALFVKVKPEIELNVLLFCKVKSE